MSDVTETDLQREVREMQQDVWRKQRAALAECRTPEEIDRCWEAYDFIARSKLDWIGQRHGLAPLMWKPKQVERG